MRNKIASIAVLILLAVSTVTTAGENRTKIVVMDVGVTQKQHASFGRKVAKYVREEMSELADIEVVTEKELKSLSRDMGFPMDYIDADEPAMGLGEQLEADFLIMGFAVKLGRKHSVTMRLLQVSTGESDVVKEQFEDKKKEMIAFAEEVIEAFRGFTRSNAEESYQIGLQYLQANDFQSAYDNFQQACAIDSTYVAALVGQVASCYGMERYDEAMALVDSAIAMDPSFGQSYYYKASLLQKEERYEEALPFFERAVEADSTYHPAYYNWALCLQQIGEMDGAIEKMQAAVDVSPEPAYRSALGRLYEDKGDLGQALQTYQQVVTEDSTYSYAWKRIITAGGDYVVLGDFSNGGTDIHGFRRSDVIDLMKDAIAFVIADAGPSAASIYDNLGTALFDIGHNEEALEVYREWERLDPSSVEPIARQVKILAAEGRQRDAIQRLEDVVEREPDNVNALAFLALAYADIGSLSEGERRASEAMSKAPLEPIPVMVAAEIKERRAEARENQAKNHVNDKSIDYETRYDQAERMFDEAIAIVKEAGALAQKALPLFREQGDTDKVDYLEKKLRVLNAEPERIEAVKIATIYAGE
jgi:tetratricopeptide (TPR) repeat protein